MSGDKHKKRNGQRPKSHNARKPRLEFLCDNNMTTRLRSEVNSIPGYNTQNLRDRGLADVADLRVKVEAVRLNTPILTFDSDFTDPVNFQICTHPGVLYINMSSQNPSLVAPRLRRFLQSRYYSKCKHAIVELREDVAIVTSRKGLEPVIHYMDT